MANLMLVLDEDTLPALERFFDGLGLNVSWEPGKTSALVKAKPNSWTAQVHAAFQAAQRREPNGSESGGPSHERN